MYVLLTHNSTQVLFIRVYSFLYYVHSLINFYGISQKTLIQLPTTFSFSHHGYQCQQYFFYRLNSLTHNILPYLSLIPALSKTLLYKLHDLENSIWGLSTRFGSLQIHQWHLSPTTTHSCWRCLHPSYWFSILFSSRLTIIWQIYWYSLSLHHTLIN